MTNKKYTYTYDDLTDDVKSRVETTKRGLRLIDEGMALLLKREHFIHEEEREALEQGRYAACAITDRIASMALQTLMTRTSREP